MPITKQIANHIYNSLLPHKEASDHVQALVLWNRPVYSTLFLIFIELVFTLIYFLPFSWGCNFCVVIGSLILFRCIYSAYPAAFDKILSFEIKPTPEDASNRIRSIPEISAFLTTIISFWSSICEFIFESVTNEDSSIISIFVSAVVLVLIFLATFFLGDFWSLWVLYHICLVIPGVILLPKVQAWLYHDDSEEDERNRPAKTETQQPAEGTQPQTTEGTDTTPGELPAGEDESDSSYGDEEPPNANE